MFKVLIATTEDNVEIEMISEESPGVPCCATVGLATTDELPLSRAYQKFVARPTGVVGSLTRHESYRLCLSRPIDTGNSWQLPVYLAHWLKHHDQLYECLGPGKAAAPEAIIWATGEVNYHLQVDPVSGMERKLSHLVRWLQNNGPGSKPVLVVVPRASIEMVKTYLEKTLDESNAVTVIGLDQVDAPQQILDQLAACPGEPAATAEHAQAAPLNPEQPAERPLGGAVVHHQGGMLIGLALFSALLIAYLAWSGNSTEAPIPKRPTPFGEGWNTAAKLPGQVLLEMLVEHRSGTEACYSMTETGKPFREQRQVIPRPIPALVKLQADPSACRITLVVHNRGPGELSGLLTPAHEVSGQAFDADILLVPVGETRSAVLLNRTEPSGMRRTSGPLMRLVLAPMSTDRLKALLANDPQGMTSVTSPSDSGAQQIRMREVQAMVDDTMPIRGSTPARGD